MFKPLAKNVLLLLWLTKETSATYAGIQKSNIWIKYENINNFKGRNEWYHEHSQISWII